MRAQPEMTAGVFEDAVDGARQPLRTPGKRLHGRLARGPAQAVEAPAVGAQPKGPLGILGDGRDRVVGEPLLHRGVAKSPVVEAAQAARSSDPKVALPRPERWRR